MKNRETCVNGKLHWLSFTQTGEVVKPFPNDGQVNDFVGTGHAVFERDGRYEVVELALRGKSGAGRGSDRRRPTTSSSTRA